MRSRGPPWFYCITVSRSNNPSHYILIYNQMGSHYRLGVLKNNEDNTKHAVLPCDQIPEWLRIKYNEVCRDSQIICP